MCRIVTIVSLIFLGASKQFITEVLMEKQNTSVRLSHILWAQTNVYGIAFPRHKQLGTYFRRPSKSSFHKARESVPTESPGAPRCPSGTQPPASSWVTCNFISVRLWLKPELAVFAAHSSPHTNEERNDRDISDDVLLGI